MTKRGKVFVAKLSLLAISISVVCALFLFQVIANNNDNELLSYYYENSVVYDKENKILNVDYRNDITPVSDKIDNYVLDIILKNGMYLNENPIVISGMNQNNEVIPFTLNKEYTITYYDDMANIVDSSVDCKHIKISFIEDVDIASMSVVYNVAIRLNEVSEIAPESESILSYGEVKKAVPVPYLFTYDEIIWEDVDTKVTAEVPSYLNDDLSLQVNKVENNTPEYEQRLKEVEALNDTKLDTLLLYDVDVVSNKEKVVIEDASTTMNIELKTLVRSEVEPMLFKAENANTLELTQPLNVEMNEKVKAVTFDSVNYDTYGIALLADTNHDGTGKTFIGDGGEYTLSYILSNYNVFTQNDYRGTHVVGPMAVGGNAGRSTLNSGGGGQLAVGGLSVPKEGGAPHTAPSYFKGQADIVNTITTDSNVPVYFGTINNTQNDKYTLVNKGHQYKTYYFTDTYIDFNDAMSKIKADSKKYEEYSGPDSSNNEIKKISIMNTDILSVKNGGLAITNENYKIFTTTDGLYVQLKLGNNYTFESFENVDNIVYDYNSLDEAKNLTTIISTKQTTEISDFPGIFKTQSDNLGETPGGKQMNSAGNIVDAYQVNSIETGEAISVMILCPSVPKITIVNEKKLTGHLVAPDADVTIKSGDYNGTVIAKNVDSAAEGHMWPFRGLKTPGTANFEFKKTVNGFNLRDGLNFNFKAEAVRVPDGSTMQVFLQTVTTTYNGLIKFNIEGFDKTGNYIFKVSEVKNPQYTCTPNEIYVKVDVTMIQDENVQEKPQINSITYYSDEACTNKIETTGSTIIFNNDSNTKMNVSKKWLDENGTSSIAPEFDSISFNLYRQAYEKNFNEIRINILYAKKSNPSNITNIKTITKNIPINYNSYNFTVKANRISYNNYSIGLHDVTSDNAEIEFTGTVNDSSKAIQLQTGSIWGQKIKNTVSGYGSYFAESTIIMNNINKDTSIDVLFYGDQFTEDPVTEVDFDFTSNDISSVSLIPVLDEQLFQSNIKLSSSNNWNIDVPNLSKEGTINGKEIFYKYYVKEIPVLGFDVSYEIDGITGEFNKTTGEGSSDGEIPIVIKNTKNGKEIKQIELTKVDASDSTKTLSSAKFRMLLKDNSVPLKFSKASDGTYYYDETNGKSDLVTNNDGKIIIKYDNLPGAKEDIVDYVLEEVEAPPGYTTSFGQIKLHFNCIGNDCYYQFDEKEIKKFDDHTTHRLTVTNDVVRISVPETGASKNKIYLIGLLVFTVGAILLGIHAMEKKKTYKGGK